MILPIDWLKDFFDESETPEELAEILLMLGFPADAINNDYLDLEVTPNRGDALSVYGIAREYAAYKDIPLKSYAKDIVASKQHNNFVMFSPEAKKVTWRYSYIVASGGEVRESDGKTKDRLKTIGLNAKNNVIDVTNYLMHESGQPIHAFDLDKIKTLNIDFAKSGDEIKILDGRIIKLKDNNLVAYDGEHLVDLVGICGGATPAIDIKSKRILIQAAIFEPSIIRKSSKSSGVSTPASYLYERGVDPELPLKVLSKVAQELEEWGFKIEEIIDQRYDVPQSSVIELTAHKLKEISGMDITSEIISNSLQRLGFDASDNDKYKVPSWRQLDVKEPVDLAEEVLRLNGFNNITPQKLETAKTMASRNDYDIDIRSYLAGEGWQEHYSYSFISAKEAEAALKLLNYQVSNLVEVANPLSALYQYMRPNFLIGLLKAANNNPWFNDVSMFEIGNVFSVAGGEISKLGFISNKKTLPGVDKIQIRPEDPLGKMLKLKRSYFYSETTPRELKIADITPQISANNYRKISIYPPVVLDLAIIVDKTCDNNKVIEEIEKLGNNILLAEVFDEYTSDKLGSDKKSIAIRIVYQDLNKTLTGEQAEEYHQQTIKVLTDRFNAQLRGTQ